jgi:hypothetical protein
MAYKKVVIKGVVMAIEDKTLAHYTLPLIVVIIKEKAGTDTIGKVKGEDEIFEMNTYKKDIFAQGIKIGDEVEVNAGLYSKRIVSADKKEYNTLKLRMWDIKKL